MSSSIRLRLKSEVIHNYTLKIYWKLLEPKKVYTQPVKDRYIHIYTAKHSFCKSDYSKCRLWKISDFRTADDIYFKKRSYS